ncbi:28S ribosomal protein S12, mitochondrial-like [Pecten maximus]|uniref:28S ribosomal protein S12, mitochondrial-like n=1 Tax=Pecten maximus TaxID=6579 RepID=UPI001458542A|nr:28S ribosomal protein S12, mitochondrial-like [Pecten maximus]
MFELDRDSHIPNKHLKHPDSRLDGRTSYCGLEMMALLGVCRQFASLSVRCLPKVTQHSQVKNGMMSGIKMNFASGSPFSRSLSTQLIGSNTSNCVRRICQKYHLPQISLQCNMTLGQLHRRGKPKKLKKKKYGILGGNAYKRGLVLKTLIKKPKKPNSASRKCVRVKLSNGIETTAYVPYEGHNLQEHTIVLLKGGRLQDVPGVKLCCVRGKYDLPHVIKKKKM